MGDKTQPVGGELKNHTGKKGGGKIQLKGTDGVKNLQMMRWKKTSAQEARPNKRSCPGGKTTSGGGKVTIQQGSWEGYRKYRKMIKIGGDYLRYRPPSPARLKVTLPGAAGTRPEGNWQQGSHHPSWTRVPRAW